MRKSIVALAMCSVLFASCFTSEHTVGSGASGSDKVVKRQWYALFGLIPINKVDSKEMAGGSSNYTIKTTHSFVDILIGVVTGFATIHPKTVEVTR